jgi:hypothetical protein
MTKGGEEAHAELRDQGVAGVELQVFRGDDFWRRPAPYIPVGKEAEDGHRADFYPCVRNATDGEDLS